MMSGWSCRVSQLSRSLLRESEARIWSERSKNEQHLFVKVNLLSHINRNCLDYCPTCCDWASVLIDWERSGVRTGGWDLDRLMRRGLVVFLKDHFLFGLGDSKSEDDSSIQGSMNSTSSMKRSGISFWRLPTPGFRSRRAVTLSPIWKGHKYEVSDGIMDTWINITVEWWITDQQ